MLEVRQAVLLDAVDVGEHEDGAGEREVGLDGVVGRDEAGDEADQVAEQDEQPQRADQRADQRRVAGRVGLRHLEFRQASGVAALAKSGQSGIDKVRSFDLLARPSKSRH